MVIAGLFMILILVVLGGGSLAGLVYIWVRAAQHATPNAGLANCGRCGYPVYTAGAMACPECGSDFRNVGIISPGMRKRYIGPVAFTSLWMLCLIVPACAISGVLVFLGPSSPIYYEDCEIAPLDTSASGYSSIMISRSPIGMYTSTFEDDMPLGYNDFLDVDIYGNNGENEWFEVDLTTMSFEDVNGPMRNAQPVTRAAVETWLGDVGADLKKPEVQTQVDEFLALMSQTRANGLGSGASSQFKSTSSSSWSEDAPALWFMLVQPVVWFVVFAAGVGVYILLYQRHQREERRLTLEALNEQQQLQAPAPQTHLDPVQSPEHADHH